MCSFCGLAYVGLILDACGAPRRFTCHQGFCLHVPGWTKATARLKIVARKACNSGQSA